MTSAIDVVEAAYRLDLEPDEWLDEVCRTTARGVADSHGVVGFEYRDRDGRFEHLRARHVRVGDTVLRVFGAFAGCRETTRPLLMPGYTCEYGRVVQDRDFTPMFGETLTDVGIWDTLGIKAVDEAGRGLFIGLTMPQPPADPAAVRRRWARVGAHVAAGFRLRRAFARNTNTVESAEAVFATSGECEHACEPARSALPALRAAVASMWSARGVRRGEPAALDLWRGLADGRWSLVDSFDSDGRRFIVALRNDPEWSDPRRLPHEERQVAVAAASGHSNKMIGYQLGVPESTVATRLSAAMQKLGCSSRVELIRMVRLLTSASNAAS